MNFRSKKFLTVISVLVALIIFGISAGAVFAQDNKESPDNNPVISRVAEILGIDKQQLVDAFKQAIKEEGQQRLDQRLQNMIDEGKITAEEAAEYKAWLEARPDIRIPVRALIFDDQLQELIDAGKITGEEAALYKEWLQSKPDIQIMEMPGKFLPHDRPMPKQPLTGCNAIIPDMN